MGKIKTRTAIPLYGLHIVLILFVFLPLIFAFTSSFRPMEDIYKYVSPLTWKTFIPENFTLEAYIEIFTKHDYGRALLNSLGIALVTVAVGIIFNGMAGFAFAKFHFPGKRLLFALVLMSYMVPFELISINLYAMMIDLNWIDTYWALIIPCIPNGMIIFLFRQYFMSFPDYLLEAAKIDGMGTVRTFFSIVLPNSKAVCTMGGDHAITTPILKGFDSFQDLCVIQIDAHLDFSYAPGGILCGQGSPMRRASEMSHIGQIVQIGMRGVGSSQSSDWADARANGNIIMNMREIRKNGMEWVLSQIPVKEHYYVTLDIDGLDQSLVPGCGSPQPFGLYYEDVVTIFENVAQKGKIVGFDLVEVCPPYDTNQSTALYAACLMQDMMSYIWKYNR